MDEYEIYESKCKKIKKENEIILNRFTKYLSNKNLKRSTIDKHVYNVEFFINDFLLYEEPLKPDEGINQLNYFLGDWFIRKAMWASISSIKENIASLKHFYTFMQGISLVTMEELYEMNEVIKENKESWLEAKQKYDDLATDIEDIW